MDDPLSRPGPDKSFACPRSVACIIVTSVSRPDYLRWASINFSLRQRGRCRHPHALAQCSPARTGEMSIVKTSPVADFKSRRLKMMSVPERLTAVGRPDGINGRDRRFPASRKAVMRPTNTDYHGFCRTTKNRVRDFCDISSPFAAPERSHRSTTKRINAVTDGNIAGIWAV